MPSRDTDRHRWTRPFCLSLVLASVLVGYVSQEQLRKANGHYQEGLASLQSDQQKAFVSFQLAVQANPNPKDAHYYLGHLYAS